MFDISWIDFFILTLATFRLTHLIVFDDITASIRDVFLEKLETTNPETGEVEKKTIPKGTGIRNIIGHLINCYWCTGIWVSLLIVFAYISLPVLSPLVLLLAIAGLAAIIETKLYA